MLYKSMLLNIGIYNKNLSFFMKSQAINKIVEQNLQKRGLTTNSVAQNNITLTHPLQLTVKPLSKYDACIESTKQSVDLISCQSESQRQTLTRISQSQQLSNNYSQINFETQPLIRLPHVNKQTNQKSHQQWQACINSIVKKHNLRDTLNTKKPVNMGTHRYICICGKIYVYNPPFLKHLSLKHPQIVDQKKSFNIKKTINKLTGDVIIEVIIDKSDNRQARNKIGEYRKNITSIAKNDLLQQEIISGMDISFIKSGQQTPIQRKTRQNTFNKSRDICLDKIKSQKKNKYVSKQRREFRDTIDLQSFNNSLIKQSKKNKPKNQTLNEKMLQQKYEKLLQQYNELQKIMIKFKDQEHQKIQKLQQQCIQACKFKTQNQYIKNQITDLKNLIQTLAENIRNLELSDKNKNLQNNQENNANQVILEYEDKNAGNSQEKSPNFQVELRQQDSICINSKEQSKPVKIRHITQFSFNQKRKKSIEILQDDSKLSESSQLTRSFVSSYASSVQQTNSTDFWKFNYKSTKSGKKKNQCIKNKLDYLAEIRSKFTRENNQQRTKNSILLAGVKLQEDTGSCMIVNHKKCA